MLCELFEEQVEVSILALFTSASWCRMTDVVSGDERAYAKLVSILDIPICGAAAMIGAIRVSRS